jgi:hypothetical protein
VVWGAGEGRTAESAHAPATADTGRHPASLNGEPGAPEASQPVRTDLNFHGLRISIAGDWPEVIDDLGADFAWFTAREDGPPDVVIEVQRTAPDFTIAGDVEASFVTPRNVVYEDAGRALIDYFGRALSVYERSQGRLLVQGEDRDLVYEAVFRFIQSRVGVHLETIGLPRLHALGLAGRDGAVAVLLPAGGGKSTLAISALRASGVRLLSEDSPLIDRRGMMHPFPLPLGVNDRDAHRLPAGQTRTRRRMELGPKTVVELEALRDRIEPRPAPLRHLVLGRRTLGTGASLEPVPRRRLARPLLRECVVGVGLYHGTEFLLQHGLRDVAGMVGPALTRVHCSAAVLRSTQTWELRLGRDHDANWAALSRLLS